MDLLAIIVRSRKGMILAVSLVVIENVAWIVEPTIFGQTIDALIEGEGKGLAGILVFPLFLWIGVYGLNSLVGGIRRVYDQRVYLDLFTHVAEEIASSHSMRKIDASKTASRTHLAREVITFFQYRVPEIIEQMIAIVGAIIGIAVLDWRMALVCFSVLFPLFFINTLYNRRVLALQETYHDDMENMFDIFQAQSPAAVRDYFNRLAPVQLRIATWGSRSFLFMRLFLLAIFIAVLYISIDLDNFSAGDIYTIVAYLWTFVTSTEYVPELLESWTSLKDITRRLKGVEELPTGGA